MMYHHASFSGSSGSALTDTNKACHDYKPQFQETLTESLQAAMKACINEGTLPHVSERE